VSPCKDWVASKNGEHVYASVPEVSARAQLAPAIPVAGMSCFAAPGYAWQRPEAVVVDVARVGEIRIQLVVTAAEAVKFAR